MRSGLLQRIRAVLTNDRDGGAVAVLIALLAVAIFGAAALAFDIARLSYERQNLQNTLDTAAQAGAFELPADPVAARTQALAFAATADPDATPANGLTVDFWCIVASTGALRQVNTAQIPGTCNPGAGPYNSTTYPGLVCNTTRCAIPCNPVNLTITCNTIRVAANKNVPFAFAPVLGIGSGQTGAVASIACKGTCGEDSPNPMDVVVVADRTPSMSDSDRNSMVGAIKSMFNQMDQTTQYVALTTIGKSFAQSGCSTRAATGYDQAGATWVATPFSNTYKTAANDPVISGLNCLNQGYPGTDLSSPLKAAARYALGLDANNLGSLPSRVGTPRKVIIFETDGRPQVNNGTSNNTTSTALTPAGDIRYSDSNLTTACNNFRTVAANAKAQGILIITIGFGDAATRDCTNVSGPATYLAAAASNGLDGSPSVASPCGTAAQRALENADKDFYFCAAAGSDLADIFETAIAQASKSIRLVPLPS